MTERTRPLAVKPFGRLLASYTVNEFGDSVGDRRAGRARLRPDRRGRAARRRCSSPASSSPRCVAPFLTARLDQLAVRRTLPWLYVVEALVFVALALIADGRVRTRRWCSSLALVDGAIAVTARALTRGAIASILQPAHLLREGNALLNIGFAFAVGRRLGAGGLADLRVRALGRAARRRRVVPGDRGRARASRANLPTPAGRAAGDARAAPQRPRVRPPRPARPAAARRPVGRAHPLHADHPDRGDLREGEPRDDERGLRHPARLVGRGHRRRQHPLRRACGTAAPPG